jgi:hypothetical protein
MLERRNFAILAVIVVLWIPAAANAEPSQDQIAAIKSACPADYKSYCSSVPPGGQASLDCLNQNVAKLSSACQSAVNAAMGTPAASASTGSSEEASSAPPAATNAAPAPKKQEEATTTKTMTTAPENTPALTPRQEIRLVRVSCGPDFRRLCGNVPLGQGRAVECLRANRSSLSKGCIGAFAELGM